MENTGETVVYVVIMFNVKNCGGTKQLDVLSIYNYNCYSVITFRASRRRHEMCIGHMCLSVCMSVRGRMPIAHTTAQTRM